MKKNPYRSLFGVIHLEDQTMLFWDSIAFFAARAFCEKDGCQHFAVYTCETAVLPDPERQEAIRQAWQERNAAVDRELVNWFTTVAAAAA